MQILAEICQNRTICKDEFFKNLTLLRSKNPELRKVAYISQDYAQKISGSFDFSGIYGELNGGQQNLFPAQKSESIASTFHQRPYLGQQKRKRKDTAGLLHK